MNLFVYCGPLRAHIGCSKQCDLLRKAMGSEPENNHGTDSGAISPLSLRTAALLRREIELEPSSIRVQGTRSPFSLAALVADFVSSAKPDEAQLVVVPDSKSAQEFRRGLEIFNPNLESHLLPHFDVSPFTGLYPNQKVVSQRLKWLHNAQNPRAGQVFIAPVAGLLQKTLPFDVLKQSSFQIKDGDVIEDFVSKLNDIGYRSVPTVEDVGTYAVRGGMIDLFSTAYDKPIRIETFADDIEGIWFFDSETQRRGDKLKTADIIPAREVWASDKNLKPMIQAFKSRISDEQQSSSYNKSALQSLVQGQHFNGLDYFLPYAYDSLAMPYDHFCNPVQVWQLSPVDIATSFDRFTSEIKEESELSNEVGYGLTREDIYIDYTDMDIVKDGPEVLIERIEIQDAVEDTNISRLDYRGLELESFKKSISENAQDKSSHTAFIKKQFSQWRSEGFLVVVSTSSENLRKRSQILFEDAGFTPQSIQSSAVDWRNIQSSFVGNEDGIPFVSTIFPQSNILVDDKVVLLRDVDLFGKTRRHAATSAERVQQQVSLASFSDLKEGDLVVHKLHGVGVYRGLQVMPISGVDSEFIQLEYKNKDKLYLPIYRIGQLQKFSSPGGDKVIDKLGGTSWEKAKTKVKSKLRDMASELLKIYSERKKVQRTVFAEPDQDFYKFENQFPYDETKDQANAIDDIVSDLTRVEPMDRLICGDVGFGKTEVSMRAAFLAVNAGQQVAVIAPTTILTYQHMESFKKRFAGWPIRIAALNRFVSKKESTKILEDLKSGQLDILIGTHRLFSKDVEFKNLGLLVIDEEQKFGVRHKEKIRKIKAGVDTLAMSATPIPRTLNMSMVGIRDLSLINTPPVDRLPTRTFVCRFDKATIRRAIETEMARGGQVFFLHNRVQSIELLASEIREIVPQARLGIGHGQMEEAQLEKVITGFFNKEIDVLICTTIIESGMDIPNANTMFIDNAHQLGLSQLYQLRGRVGRSKERAYCYLLVPQNVKLERDAEERLRVIQENTALGSGLRIAQHDLELRGAGQLLGENQSGHIQSVGYELYMELLQEALKEEQGDTSSNLKDIDPEINLRIPALIPDNYIPDIRVRLGYYKALSQISSEADLELIEDDLRDQFGKLPEPVINLMGVMLIRKTCKDLRIKDLSAGKKTISLQMDTDTPLSVKTLISLASRENKKYSITPDNRLNIRMNEIEWARVYEEINYLAQLV